VPDFDALIDVMERDRNQRFTPEEIEEKRKEAPAIVLLKDEAAMMIASRSWITEPALSELPLRKTYPGH
jgi:hypothetical protein